LANVKHRTMIGGQAVIEGVMMRGVKTSAMAVRKPDGTINLSTWQNSSIKDKYPVLKFPVLRGVVNFVEMLIDGYKTLMQSAEIAGLEDEPKTSKDINNSSTVDTSNIETTTKSAAVNSVQGDSLSEPVNDNASQEVLSKEDKAEEKGMSGIMVKLLSVLSALIGIALAILLFTVTPALVTFYTKDILHFGIFTTLIEGVIRIIIFVLYLVVVSLLKDIQRVFEYHGAEHKTIYCYENNEELTVENARKNIRFHPRCGTSFLLIVLIVSILVFSFVPWNNLFMRIILKLLLLPLVVGISYEIIRFAGRHDNSVMRFLLAPGLWLQRLTTREPDDSQLEVAINALEAVLTANKEDDKW
jgi:uncharacterized protein YqhQ